MFLCHLYPFSPPKSNSRRPCNLSLGIFQKLSHQLEMFNKADLPAQDKEKARASLNMDNAHAKEIHPREFF